MFKSAKVKVIVLGVVGVVLLISLLLIFYFVIKPEIVDYLPGGYGWLKNPSKSGVSSVRDESGRKFVVFPNLDNYKLYLDGSSQPVSGSQGQNGVNEAEAEDALNIGVSDFLSFIVDVFPREGSPKNWNSWDWEKYYVFAQIKGILPESNSLVVSIMAPKGKDFSDKNRVVRVDCPGFSSAILSTDNFKSIKTNVNILEEAATSESIYFYCLDPQCDSVGRSCMLIRSPQND